MKAQTLDKLKSQLITIYDTEDELANYEIISSSKYPPSLKDFYLIWHKCTQEVLQQLPVNIEEVEQSISFMSIGAGLKTPCMALDDIETIFIPALTAKICKENSYDLTLQGHTFGIAAKGEFFSIENLSQEENLILVLRKHVHEAKMFFRNQSVDPNTTQPEQLFEDLDVIYLFETDAVIKVRNDVYEFGKGDVFIIPSNTKHQILNTTDQNVEYMALSIEKLA